MASREGAVRDLDLTVSAINYLAEKGYAFFRTFENDRNPDENIRHHYLFRRKK